MWSTWGTSRDEDKLGARAGILYSKVARRARPGQTFPLGGDSDQWRGNKGVAGEKSSEGAGQATGGSAGHQLQRRVYIQPETDKNANGKGCLNCLALSRTSVNS